MSKEVLSIAQIEMKRRHKELAKDFDIVCENLTGLFAGKEFTYTWQSRSGISRGKIVRFKHDRGSIYVSYHPIYSSGVNPDSTFRQPIKYIQEIFE